ncbi:transporter substrate-binding domain-containing protein [Pseudomonas brenneri]|uniref:transporter substrate-binding domain-containing protein n=1 Tax=Pseudomonas brenneri TaxID=129817 RepID=UPI0025A2622C|nr:transporter substrate-binding domain-containing protein [Pseudomonas brenneri]WJM88925.1 transporter substrate-binding domain-containing protein [Pseudomonas brenneri]
MSTLARIGALVGWLLIPCLSASVQAADNTQSLYLLGRSEVQGYQVDLSADDWVWLRNQRQLVLGITPRGTAPFELNTDGGDYEGLIADYAKLLGELLKIRIDVRLFASREDAITALSQGRADLLAIGRDTEEGDTSLSLSRAYADDGQVLVSRENADALSSSDLAGKRIAAAEFYWTPQELESMYPKASIQMYPSVQTAVGAVAFNRADVYLGEAITASYLINKNYPNDLQLAQLSISHGGHFAFVLPSQDKRLLRMVNSALEAIPLAERLVILRRWSAGAEGLPGQYFLSHSLTPNERRWLAKHPRLKVAVSENFMPVSFLDGRNVFRGISADVLAKVAQRTGLKFEPVYADTVNSLADLVKKGRADFLATFTKSNEREKYLMFSRPYLIEPVVLVSRAADESVASLADLSGKRVAVTHGTAQAEFIRSQFPYVQQVEAQSVPNALALLSAGTADAAVGAMMNVRYQIAQHYQGQLQVAATVDNFWAQTAFATRRDSPELLSILNKALLSISPEEMDELASRWRGDIVIGDSFWVRHRDTLSQVAIAGLLILLITLVWVGYLGQLVFKRKQAEKALNEQVEFLRVLIDGTPHPIYVRDRAGRLLICNAGYLEACNISRDEVLGKRLSDVQLLGPEKAADIESIYQHVMERGQAWTSDRTMTFANGQSLTVYHWVFPYQGSDGQIAGIISGWIDVSERQYLLNQLQVAKDEAEVANRAKTTFLAIMSHEIRTPMNAMTGGFCIKCYDAQSTRGSEHYVGPKYTAQSVR